MVIKNAEKLWRLTAPYTLAPVVGAPPRSSALEKQLQFSKGVLRQIQHWKNDQEQLHVARGGKVILSPSSRLYLDMKYDSDTVLGLKWAA